MHRTRRGKQWYFGMKLHIEVDSRRGLIGQQAKHQYTFGLIRGNAAAH